jgi:hypothetical protein
LIRQLIERAHTERKLLRRRVLLVNPARILYEHLGFAVSHSTRITTTWNIGLPHHVGEVSLGELAKKHE